MRCIHVIQSPSPYLIGVDSRFFEFFQLPQADEDISVVDLDTRLFRPAIAVPALPRGPLKRLRAALLQTEERVTELSTRMYQESKLGVRVQEKYKAYAVCPIFGIHNGVVFLLYVWLFIVVSETSILLKHSLIE